MENDDKMKSKDMKKPLRLKNILQFIFILFLVAPILVFILFTKQKYDPVSAAIIRNAAAEQLDKDPNDLTNEDFASIKELRIARMQISDIKLLEKFTNIQVLYIGNISCPPTSIPKWMSIMSKFGIINLEEKFALNISPLEKLNALEKLIIYDVRVYNVESLSNLTKLQYLVLENTLVSDVRLTANLQNLKGLYLDGTKVSNLEPLKNLKNLEHLNIKRCKNITDEQVEELQKSLPDCKITR